MVNGNVLTVTDSKVLKVRYAMLPIVDLSARFMVQVMEPVPMVPYEISFRHDMTLKQSLDDLLREAMLSNWKNQGGDAVRVLEGVELIECDLLTPKAASNG